MNDFQRLKKLDNGGYGTVFTGYDENGRTGKERLVFFLTETSLYLELLL